MKYVVFEDDTAVIFPDWIEHIVVGSRLAPRCGPPIRAGFVRLTKQTPVVEADGSGVRFPEGIKAEVYGESISLSLKSHPSDNALIEKAIKS